LEVARSIAAALFAGRRPSRARRWYRVGLLEAREAGDPGQTIALALALGRVGAADGRAADVAKLEAHARSASAATFAAVRDELLLRAEIAIVDEPRAQPYERALAAASARGDGFAVAEAFDRLAEVAIIEGDGGALRRAREGALAAVRERGPVWRVPYQAAQAARAAWLAGDLAAASERLALARAAEPESILGRLATAAAAQELEPIGDVDEALAALARRRGSSSVAAAYLTAAVDARLRADDVAGARELLDPRLLVPGHVDALALALRFPIAARERDLEKVARLVARWRRVARGRGVAAYFALFDALEYRRAGRRRKMRSAAGEAAERFAAAGWPALEHVATALRDGVRSTVPLLAQPAMEPRDAPPVGERGGTPLTQREREVARLVIDGLKNREIGERLRISEHTVEHHVTAILAKLRLASRWQIRERARSDAFPDLS